MRKPSSHNLSATLRVVLIEDRPNRRAGLRFNDADGYECVGSYNTIAQAVSEIRMWLEAETPSNTVLLVQRMSPLKHDYHLTPHETRILALLVEGRSYKATAAALGVSINTVSFHVRRIYDKLQVHSKAEAVAKALRNHLM